MMSHFIMFGIIFIFVLAFVFIYGAIKGKL